MGIGSFLKLNMIYFVFFTLALFVSAGNEAYNSGVNVEFDDKQLLKLESQSN